MGAVTNQIYDPSGGSGVGLSDSGISFPDGTLQATAASADPRRASYVTADSHNGAQTLNACAPDFHMASIWEIRDVSNLRYATDEEDGNNVLRREDSGVGPPSGIVGWVRTGFTSSASATEGSGNCSVWTSASGSDFGTLAQLESVWSLAGEADPITWNEAVVPCSAGFSVWCVEN